ncbi:MAG: glycosyltransferase family 4 protein [Anaerolineae bacterium]
MNIGLDGRFIQDHYPGIGRYTYQLALALARRRPHDTFIILHHPGATNTRYDLEPLARMPNVRLAGLSAAPLSLASQWQVRQVAQREGLTLFHTPHYPMSYFLHCPVVATLHDLTPWLVPGAMTGGSARRLFWLLMRLAAWRSAAVITGSKQAAQDLQQYLELSPSRITVAPHGVDTSFHPVERGQVDEVRDRFKLDKPYVLYCGSNKPHKNIARLVEAWAALPASLRAEYSLVLAGAEDPRHHTGQHLAQQYGVLASTIVLGDCRGQDLPALYSGACGFVFPSLYEGFGLPVLEAMACGTAVVCSNSSSLPEVVGEAGLMFEALDVHAISSAIQLLLSDSALRQRLAQAGLERARTFTWDHAAEITLGVYQAIGSGRR